MAYWYYPTQPAAQRYVTYAPTVQYARPRGVNDLVRTGAGVSAYDQQLVLSRLAHLPQAGIDAMRGAGAQIHLFEGRLTDQRGMEYLRGIHPEGWPAGATWDIVPGAGAGPYGSVGAYVKASVERTRLGQGSASLALHEAAHAVDRSLGYLSRTAMWNGGPMAEIRARGGAAYFTTQPDEWFAEALALYSLNGSTNAALRSWYPQTYAALQATLGAPQYAQPQQYVYYQWVRAS